MENNLKFHNNLKREAEESQNIFEELKNWEKETKCKVRPRTRKSTEIPIHVNVDGNEDKDELERKVGNVYFKNGDLGKALEHYTLSINFNPDNGLSLSNRSLLHLKLKNFRLAEEDATKALKALASYDEKSVILKCLLRRAKARKKLGKLKAAFYDLQGLLKLDPKNKIARLNLEELYKLIKISAENSPSVDIEVEAEAEIEELESTPSFKEVDETLVNLPEKTSINNLREFEDEINKLRIAVNQKEKTVSLLRKISVKSSLRRIFTHRGSFEADYLTVLCEPWKTAQPTKDEKFFLEEFFKQLPTIPDFNMVSIFISQGEKAFIQQISPGVF
eukprot:augustus_masked-scaffold_8-processed-gene-3.6-mRNA-1 protein AED:0.34 eAED:0.38 QI:0/-1/0/1/-1/1/1/0/332